MFQRRLMSTAPLALLLAALPAFADVTAPAVQENSNVVILDANQAQRCFRRTFGFFTPRTEDVRQLERLLPSSIARFAEQDPAAVMRDLAHRVSSHFAADKRFWFGRVDENGPHAADVDWSVEIRAECCKEPRIEPRPGVMSLGDDTLVDWERSCGDGLGGPHRRTSSKVDFHYIHLDVKDRTTLRFSVTPGYELFDESGRNTQGGVQGCSSFRGEARLRDRSAPPLAN